MAESPWGANIDMNQFTTNVVTDNTTHVVTGDGIFDILMNTATQHIAAQYEAGRIRGEDYSVAYTQIFQASLQAAVQIWTNAANNLSAEKQNQDRIDAQANLIAAQVNSEVAKKELYYRQIEGFDEDYKQKLLKIMIDGHAVFLSVVPPTSASGLPLPMSKGTIDSFWAQVNADVDIGASGLNTRTVSKLSG